jgi:nicotinamide-nucleotide amidase
MRCEVVAIGTELLLGQIVDTNSSWIGEQLALVGIDSLFQVKVGDNAARMEETIRHALERSDAVICCGGLGPTQDDITREVIANIMGVGMRRDEAIALKIRDMFEARGRVMPDNNLRQADIPTGATPIAQMPGTAPGLVCPIGVTVLYAVRGVPFEMREMMEGTILSDLRRRSGQTAVIRSRVMRTWGHGESALAETLAARIDELDELGTATLAFQASGIEGIKVRITAKAADDAAAEEILSAEEALIRDLLGDFIFGVDEETMESVVLDELRQRGLTLSAAEHLTGGILATRMTALDPDLEVFRGSVVGVLEETDKASMDDKRAAAAAQRARAQFGTDIGIATLAPGDMEDYPPGTVFLGVAMAGTRKSRSVTLPGARSRMRSYAVISLLDYLRKTLAAEG